MNLARCLCAGLMAALCVLWPVSADAQAQRGVTILAAASLANVMQEIGSAYERSSGKKVTFSFAGSMILAKQIEASLGADIFISADIESMDYLDRKNLIARPTRANLFGNSLVLIAPASAKPALRVEPGFKLAEALNGGRLALASPDIVPAGRYGKAALTSLGVWDRVKSHLAEGEDVRATLAFVARGEAPFGIVYATDARVEPRVKVVGTFPPSSHQPILYPAALLKDAGPGAAQFFAYLKGSETRSILERAGFRFAQSP